MAKAVDKSISSTWGKPSRSLRGVSEQTHIRGLNPSVSESTAKVVKPTKAPPAGPKSRK